jgi:Ca2+-binding EF-hand superfamily protein
MDTELKLKTAMEMTIMDAMEKGHTDKNNLIEYMKSFPFEQSAKRYFDMITEVNMEEGAMKTGIEEN